MSNELVALFGPTALGKTEIAVGLAEQLGAEIVVADSMQIYDGLPLLTNQPTAEQRRRARHHLVAFVPPQQDYSVAEYAQRAHEAIDALLAAGKRVIIEGGSGLYLRAALGELTFGGGADPALRRRLEEQWRCDPGLVISQLRELDPELAASIDVANPRRLLRALESVLAAGRPLRGDERDRLWQPAERYRYRLFGLQPAGERAELYQRIDERVAEMLVGAADEVRAALAAGPFSRSARQAIGVEEICALLDDAATQEQVAASMRSRTHALVRRQLTWQRRIPDVELVPVVNVTSAVDAILHLLTVPRDTMRKRQSMAPSERRLRT